MAPKGAVKTRPTKTASTPSGDTRVIGGREFVPAELVWSVQLEAEDILARQERLFRRASRLRVQAGEIEDEAKAAGETPDDDAIDTKFDEARAMDRDANALMFPIVACLLRDTDGKPPTVEFLQEHLEMTEGLAIVQDAFAAVAPDPTPTPDTSTTSSS